MQHIFEQEATHIRIQQAQLISHHVLSNTQHPLEQQMLDITALLSQFTQLVTQQQEDVLYIQDSAQTSLGNVKAGKEQLVQASENKKQRNRTSRHLLAWIIVTLACTLLFFHWIIP
jgi:t-SNARE complex subunit (syntaxin)